jgi:opacity protein-like surface antigen
MNRMLTLGAAAVALVTGLAAQAAEEGVLSELRDNASYTVETYGAGFRQSYPNATRRTDDNAAESWNRFTAESKTGLGRDLTFDAKAFGVLSTQEDERRGVLSEPGYRGARPRTVDFIEAKVRWAGEHFNALAGKMLHGVGVSNLFSPSNRFNNIDAAHPMHSIEMGVWSTRAEAFIGDDTLALAVIPWQDRPGEPPRSSRWLGSSGSYDFTNISTLGVPAGSTIETRDDFRATTIRNYGYLAYYKGSRPGFDFFGVVHNGPSVYPVLRRDGTTGNRFTKETPPAFTAGGGLSTTRGAWSYYGEAIAQLTHEGRDQDFVKYVLGVSYRETEFAETVGLEEIMPIVEYAGEGVFGRQDDPNYAADSRYARPARDTLLLRLALRQTDKLTYAVGGARNFETRDYFWTGGVEYKFNDNLKIRGDLRIFSGNPETDYGRWARNDHVEVGLVYKF